MKRHEGADAQAGLQGSLKTGAVLVGLGGAMGFIGMMIAGVSAATSLRQWMGQLEQPPSAVAKVKWHQAVQAGSAGIDAWRKSA